MDQIGVGAPYLVAAALAMVSIALVPVSQVPVAEDQV
jgi:hypothetical protein